MKANARETAALRVLNELQAATPAAYQCPGERSPVSAAVHRARLESGWPGCTDCPFHPDVDPHSDGQPAQEHRQPQSLQPSDESPVPRVRGPRFKAAADTLMSTTRHMRSGIRVTKFGVRGPYLNHLNRPTAALLAGVMAVQLQRQFAVAAAETVPRRGMEDDNDPQPQLLPAITVVTGFDGRYGSPDLYAGVVTAIRHSGCHVFDAGRNTAAALLHSCQKLRHSAGVIYVTGAGGEAGEAGIDVLDRNGHGISVPWSEFGFAVRKQPEKSASATFSVAGDNSAQSASSEYQQNSNLHERSPGLSAETEAMGSVSSRPASEESSESRLNEVLRNLRHRQTGNCVSRSPGDASTMLVFPGDAATGVRRFRAGRNSGTLSTRDTESDYRRWLQRWWPASSSVAVQFFTVDCRLRDRLEWLARRGGYNIHVESSPEHRIETAEVADAKISFHIAEDDRFFQISNQFHQRLPLNAAADWLNSNCGTLVRHVTAHVTDSPQRLVLMDVGDTDDGHTVISDALAVAGLFLNVLTQARCALPIV